MSLDSGIHTTTTPIISPTIFPGHDLRPIWTPSPTIYYVPSESLTPTLIPDSDDSREVLRVIERELECIILKDLVCLRKLYASDAVVVDVAGTPDDRTDDIEYKGWNSIYSRYLKIFYYGWESVRLVNLTISVEGNEADAVHEGVYINGRYYDRHIGRYHLVKDEGIWVITRLEFNYR